MSTAKARKTAPVGSKAASSPPRSASLPTHPFERVARIAAILADAAPRNEAAGRLVPEVVDALHGQRLFRMLLPKAYGGDEVAPPDFFHTMVALASLDASTAWCIGQQNGCAMAAAYLDPQVADEVWGRDPRAALAWGPPLRTQAIAADGGYRITGAWSFASGIRHATWIGMQCNVQSGDSGASWKSGGMANRIFLVPADRIKLEATWDVIGLRATGSDSWSVADMLVAERYGVRRDTPADRRIKTPLYHFPSMAMFALGFSGVAIGTARALLDSFIGLARGKTQRGVGIPLRDNHAVQMQVAEAEARLRGAQSYVGTTIERIWEQVLAADELTDAQRLDIRLATTHALHEAKTAADIAWDAAGSTAIARSEAFERRFRDIHTVTQQVQGRRTHLQTVGAAILGHEPDMSWV